MAIGRSRNNKRQSYTSYTSTITTVVFIGLCVLGVWMLTSDSVTPQTTQHATVSTATTKTSNDNNNDDSTSLHEPEITKNNDKKDGSSFHDNPGELPDDAIKSEDTHQSESGHNVHEDRNNGQDNKSGDSFDKSGIKQESVEENGKQQERENENEKNQVSEESTMTLKEHVDDESGHSVNSETGENKESNDDQQRQQHEEQQQPEEQQQQQREEQQLVDRQEEQKKQGKEDDVDQSNENETAKDQQEEQKKQRKEDEVDQSKESETAKDQLEEQRKQRKEDEADQNNESETAKDQQEEQRKEGKEDEADRSNESETEKDQGKQQLERQQETQEKAQSNGDESNEQSSQDDSKTHEKNPEEPRNEISEEDRQQRIEEQHRQRIEDQRKVGKNSNGDTQQEPEHRESKEDNHQQEVNNTSKLSPALSNDQTEEHQKKSDSTEENEHDGNADGGEDEKISESKSDGSFHGGNNSEIPKESNESKKSWKTQKSQSENQKERRQIDSDNNESIDGHEWQLCNVTAGTDYIPCLDNEKALRHLHSTRHFEHRERHCPEDPPACLVPLPQGYKRPIEWPKSRDKIWYHNVPHTLLADVKGHQNWVKVTGEFLTFPGGGTQFIHGALHYIDFLQKSVPNIKWGKHTRVVLDVGCGVASFGGHLFERDVLTMSFAPKDEHEAQVQFALERGIPAISAVMGSKRLPFPSRVFDAVHCARCRVPWHAEGGTLLLELNRVLRPGGFFIWSATPVYQKLQEDVEIWNAMTELTASMCWELVTIQRDKLNHVGVAIYHKPRSNDCYDQRKQTNPPMCKNDDDPNAAWYVPLQPCMHRNPTDESQRGTRWPVVWPRRLRLAPNWLNGTQMGIYGKPAPQDFIADYEHWKHVVSSKYMSGLGISWSGVRNVMDMRAVYGGFAAALKDLQMWVMNVVNVDSPDTLPIIYERGLFGIYHDWCESFSTYPRSYDLLHADHLFSKLKKRCNLVPVMAEVDRIVRPGGKIIVRDDASAIRDVENLLKSLHWEVYLTFSKNQEGILSAQKGNWRPKTYVASS